MDTQQPVEQPGFRNNYLTIDRIHTLNDILEKNKEYDLKIGIVFVDINKAFVLIYHDSRNTKGTKK